MAAEVLKPREWDDLFDCTDLAEHRELKQAKDKKDPYILSIDERLDGTWDVHWYFIANQK